MKVFVLFVLIGLLILAACAGRIIQHQDHTFEMKILTFSM